MILKCDVQNGRVGFNDSNGKRHDFSVDAEYIRSEGVVVELVMYLGHRAVVITPDGRSVSVWANDLVDG